MPWRGSINSKKKVDGLDSEQQARLMIERLQLRPLKERKLAREIEESTGTFGQRSFSLCRATVDRWLEEDEPKETRAKDRKEVDRGGGNGFHSVGSAFKVKAIPIQITGRYCLFLSTHKYAHNMV